MIVERFARGACGVRGAGGTRVSDVERGGGARGIGGGTRGIGGLRHIGGSRVIIGGTRGIGTGDISAGGGEDVEPIGGVRRMGVSRGVIGGTRGIGGAGGGDDIGATDDIGAIDDISAGGGGGAIGTRGADSEDFAIGAVRGTPKVGGLRGCGGDIGAGGVTRRISSGSTRGIGNAGGSERSEGSGATRDVGGMLELGGLGEVVGGSRATRSSRGIRGGREIGGTRGISSGGGSEVEPVGGMRGIGDHDIGGTRSIGGGGGGDRDMRGTPDIGGGTRSIGGGDDIEPMRAMRGNCGSRNIDGLRGLDAARGTGHRGAHTRAVVTRGGDEREQQEGQHGSALVVVVFDQRLALARDLSDALLDGALVVVVELDLFEELAEGVLALVALLLLGGRHGRGGHPSFPLSNNTTTAGSM